MSARLEVRDLAVSYGRIEAVHSLSFDLRLGSSLALLGANGAGKTTAVEAIAGLLPKSRGSVRLDGEEASAWPADRLARAGLALVPQWRELFPGFTVEETLLAGLHASARRRGHGLDAIYALFPKLWERREQTAATLSGGEQQMLALGRALATAPMVLLLDEPTAGLSAGVRRDLVVALQAIRERGIPMLLIEQDMQLAAAIADECIVMAAGDVAWRGPTHEAAQRPEVRRAYFGAPAGTKSQVLITSRRRGIDTGA